MTLPFDLPTHNRIKPKTRPMNAMEKRHAAEIAEMGCLVCGRDAEIHHETGSPRQAKNHMHIAPLCPEHHRHGKDARHVIGYAAFCKLLKFDLLDWAKERAERFLRMEAMR